MVITRPNITFEARPTAEWVAFFRQVGKTASQTDRFWEQLAQHLREQEAEQVPRRSRVVTQVEAEE